MFEEILKNFNVKTYKPVKPKKIQMPSLEELPPGPDRHRMYCTLYKQIPEEKEKNKLNCKKNNKPYFEKNRERLREKHLCECGNYYMLYNKSHHLKSKKHIKLIAEIEEAKLENEE